MRSFNLNDNVRVKLTEHGHAILKADIDSVDYCDQDDLKNYAHSKAEPDADGYNTFHMWQLMSVFGSHMYNGAKNVFENNAIDLDF